MDERRMDAIGDTAARAASSMQHRLNRVSERAQDYVSDAGDQLSQIRGSMGPYMDQARRFVQERPLRPALHRLLALECGEPLHPYAVCLFAISLIHGAKALHRAGGV